MRIKNKHYPSGRAARRKVMKRDKRRNKGLRPEKVIVHVNPTDVNT